MGKCTLITAIAGGVFAASSVALAEANLASTNVTGTPMTGVTAKTLKSQSQPWVKQVPWLINDSESINALTAQAAGPVADQAAFNGGINAEAAVFCGICDANSPDAQETALPSSWTTYGDAFANTPAAIAGKWLRDNGCFVITACFGATTPANALQYPAAFDYTTQLVSGGGNFKVCGWISNITSPNDPGTTTSLFTIQPQNPPNGPTFGPSPACGSITPTNSPNARDQDYIRINVPAGGMSNFRLFITGGASFSASLICNKNFPAAGVINGCWTDAGATNSPPAEFGFSPYATPGTDLAVTNPDSTNEAGPEGAKDSTWAWPRSGTRPVLEEGQYLLTIRLKPFAQQPGFVAPTTRYQIQVIGTLGSNANGACCVYGTNTCTDNISNTACDTANGVWRGTGTTCATVDPGCNLTCSGTAEGAGTDCPNATDSNDGCFDPTTPDPVATFTSIACGQTYCAFSGTTATGVTPAEADSDWYQYTNTTGNKQAVKFSLSTEFRARFFFLYAGTDPFLPCADFTGFGFGFTDAVENAEIEVCIPDQQEIWILVDPNEFPLAACGSPNGPAYKLTLTCAACSTGACCALNGNCTEVDGLACYAAGGVSLGEGTTCASTPCCADTAVCAGSTQQENEPAGNCVTAANFNTRVDSFNGGCDETAPSFTSATAGALVCGSSSSFRAIGDADWYTVTTTGESFIGALVDSQMDIEVDMYQAPVGGGCPSDAAGLAALLLESDAGAACGGPVIVGNCLPAGTYYFRVAARFSNSYEVPCGNGKYLINFFNGICTGTAVSCTGTAEGEANCQATGSNEGCNDDTITAADFITVSCNQTICGTADVLAGSRDTDWYKVNHPGGQFKVTLNSQFYGLVAVTKPGVTGPQGCDDLTGQGGLIFVLPNAPETLTIASLAAGTYYVTVAPDFEGTDRVCCGTNYSMKIECTPACPCTADINGDCIVNTADLTALLGNFGRTCGANPNPPCPLAGDLNGDNTVNTADLTTLLGQFGRQNVGGVCQ